VNTRAGITACTIGQPPLAQAPASGAPVTVSYAFAYDDGALLGGFSGFTYTSADNVPAPAPLGSGVVRVRVKATVTIGGTNFTDPAYGPGDQQDFTCG
jgi:hypothetical protein